MNALFQIGKEFANLEARVRAIEGAKCSCKARSRAIKDSSLPKQQLVAIEQLRGKHAEVFAEFNKILRELKLPEGLVVGRFTLMDERDLAGVDDEDQCCICCLNGSDGYEYCCDYAGCSCCS